MKNDKINNCTILCDIGGTFARFAIGGAGEPERVAKFVASDFVRFEDALAHYCTLEKIEGAYDLRIATAAYEDEGVWRFINNNEWVIDPSAAQMVVNDFEAATWALADIKDEDCTVLKAGAGASNAKCLIGPGTGLGLGFLFTGRDGAFVQKTHGGHMPVSILNEQQYKIVAHVQGAKAQASTAVYEDFVSGHGLYNIYCAICAINGHPVLAQDAADILTHKDTEAARESLRLFHEFFGQFAANAVITASAYGGVYMSGGVLAHLMDADLFNIDDFKAGFLIGGAPSVARDLEATPIMVINNPYPALKGLIHA